MTKSFLQAINGQQTNKVPFWFMRQAGRYLPEYRKLRAKAGSFLDLCYNPDFAVEVTLQPIRRFDMDAAILFSDILVVPDALGQDLRFVTGKGPELDPIRSREDLSHIAFDAERFHQRLDPVYQTIRGLTSALPADKTLIGFAGSPWTVASYMIEGGSSKDFQHIKKFAFGDPKGFQQLIDLLVEATAAYLIRQVDHGAEALQIFDSWSGVLGEAAFEDWIIAPTQSLIQKIRAVHPDVPIIGFPKGAGLYYPRYAKLTGVSAISFDHTLPLDFVKSELQSLCPVQGGLDNGALLTGGTSMIAQTDKIIEALGDGPFVFNLGHGVIKETPPEHVDALSNHLKSISLST